MILLMECSEKTRYYGDFVSGGFGCKVAMNMKCVSVGFVNGLLIKLDKVQWIISESQNKVLLRFWGVNAHSL